MLLYPFFFERIYIRRFCESYKDLWGSSSLTQRDGEGMTFEMGGKLRIGWRINMAFFYSWLRRVNINPVGKLYTRTDGWDLFLSIARLFFKVLRMVLSRAMTQCRIESTLTDRPVRNDPSFVSFFLNQSSVIWPASICPTFNLTYEALQLILQIADVIYIRD